MTPEIRRMTQRYGATAAVTSFLTQPIPGVDELVVVPIQYLLVARLAHARGVALFSVPWRPVQKLIWTGAGARVATNMTIGLVPIVGGFANAGTAFALTQKLGRYLDAALDEPDKTPPEVSFAMLKAEMLEAAKRAGAAWPDLAAKLRGTLARISDRAFGRFRKGPRTGVAPAAGPPAPEGLAAA